MTVSHQRTYEISLHESRPQQALQLIRSIRPDRLGEDLAEGARQIYEVAERLEVAPAGPLATTPCGEETCGEIELTLPVHTGEGAVPEFQLRRTTSGQYAATVHYGDYRAIGQGYRALRRWVAGSAYHECGPVTEEYLVGPDSVLDPAELVTRIRVPVEADGPLSVMVAAPFDITCDRARYVLRRHGYTTVTEFNVRAAPATDHETEIGNYLVLGVWHPVLSRQALGVDRDAGLLMPHSVVIRAEGGGTRVVSADPTTTQAPTPAERLAQVRRRMRMDLEAALSELAGCASVR
jgi:uncharacterized protein (DUF302 family)/effector-binding domain-containing protein